MKLSDNLAQVSEIRGQLFRRFREKEVGSDVVGVLSTRE
jgi:hypothetical protein